MSSDSNSIVFTYDIVCPYAYIASQHIEAVAKRCNATLEWRPVLLGGIYKLDKASQGAGGSASDVMSAAKKRNMAVDLYRQAARYGAVLNMPDNHPQRSINAMRILSVTEPMEKRVKLSKAMYKAYWVDGQDITDAKLIDQLCKQHNVDSTVASNDKGKDALLRNTHGSFDDGGFGVPYMMCRRASGEKDSFFGGDRLHYLEKFFIGDKAREYRAVPDKQLTHKPDVQFVFDFSSPWTYIAYTQLDVLRRVAHVHMMPVLLGAVFRSTGGPMIPMNAVSDNKRAYLSKDLRDTLSWHDVKRFRFNTHFPLRTVTALRIAIAEPKTTECLFRAAWEDDVDFNDTNAVKHALSNSGFDADKLTEQAGTESVKKQLSANTEYALSKHVFGCPTYINMDDGSLLFGGDRVPALLDLINGFTVDLPLDKNKWPLRQSPAKTQSSKL